MDAGLPNISWGARAHATDYNITPSIRPINGCVEQSLSLPRTHYPDIGINTAGKYYNDYSFNMDTNLTSNIYGYSNTVTPLSCTICFYIKY